MYTDINSNTIEFSEQANMAKYLQSIKHYPLLSSEEEYQLAKQYTISHDRTLANKLITSQLLQPVLNVML